MILTKRFDIPLYQNDAYVFVYVLFIFNFFAYIFHLAFSYFLIYDCFLYIILLVTSFFSFYAHLYMFINLQKAALSLAIILFKQFLCLINFWADFCWFITRHTKRFDTW